MDKKEIYKLIRVWECDAGEGFFEYFGDNACLINENVVMAWMYGKGYIDSNKFNLFGKATATKTKNFHELPSISNCLCGYETAYSLFPFGECEEDAIFKAELVLAELIAGNEVYENRLEDFAYRGKGWASFDSKEEKKNHEEYLRKKISEWDEEDDEEYNKIEKLTIEEINKRLAKERNDENQD